THLKILSKLARALVRGDFIDRLRSAATADDIVAAVTDVVGEAGVEKQADQPAAAPAAAPGENVTRIVAVTACPTGIAHTYMAADALTLNAQGREDVELVVETQGSSSTKAVDPDIIAAADAVIFATDVGVR